MAKTAHPQHVSTMVTALRPAGSARRAAKVLWVAASGCGEDGRRRLWLWAVDRLSGVTMNGAVLVKPPTYLVLTAQVDVEGLLRLKGSEKLCMRAFDWSHPLQC